MGYYTSYRLECGDASLIEKWIESGECDEACYALDTDGSTLDSVKWYDHETDMRALSAKHPDVLFTLHGRGEEGERWRKFFLGGKMHAPDTTVIVPDFDPKELR